MSDHNYNSLALNIDNNDVRHSYTCLRHVPANDDDNNTHEMAPYDDSDMYHEHVLDTNSTSANNANVNTSVALTVVFEDRNNDSQSTTNNSNNNNDDYLTPFRDDLYLVLVGNDTLAAHEPIGRLCEVGERSNQGNQDEVASKSLLSVNTDANSGCSNINYALQSASCTTSINNLQHPVYNTSDINNGVQQPVYNTNDISNGVQLSNSGAVYSEIDDVNVDYYASIDDNDTRTHTEDIRDNINTNPSSQIAR